MAKSLTQLPLNDPCSSYHFSPLHFARSPTQRQTTHSTTRPHLTVPPVRLRIMLLPNLPPPTLGVVVPMPLVDASRLLPRGGQTPGFTVLVHGLGDPVDAGVAADGLMLRVDEDDLVVLVGGVLVDPVGVEDAEIGAAAADALFGGGFQGALVFQLIYSLVGRFACRICQMDWFWGEGKRD